MPTDKWLILVDESSAYDDQKNEQNDDQGETAAVTVSIHERHLLLRDNAIYERTSLCVRANEWGKLTISRGEVAIILQ